MGGTPPTLADFLGGTIPATTANAWIAAIRYALNTNPQGVIYRARRITQSTAAAGLQGVLRIDAMTLISGRGYRFWTSGLVASSTVSGDWVAAQLRFDATGAAATTASAQMAGGQARMQALTGNGNITPISVDYYPGANQTVSVLLCTTRISGTGNVSLFGDANNATCLVVEDLGIAPADTGVSL